MDYPIVYAKTSDDLYLHGLFIKSPNSKTAFLHIHGTASNFYEEDFIEILYKNFLERNISLLSTNNRGAGVYDAWQQNGAAVEKFEDCVIDIDTWIEFLVEKGYDNIVLAGHSLGTEKVVYYMNHGKNVTSVKGLVLLAPADSYGYNKGNILNLKEAEKFIKDGKPETFLARNAYAGIMPKSAESYVNFLGEKTELLKALPFHTRKLEWYAKIKIPILAIIGDEHEYTVIPIEEALALMQNENSNTHVVQLTKCSHDFEGHEEELAQTISDFISKLEFK